MFAQFPSIASQFDSFSIVYILRAGLTSKFTFIWFCFAQILKIGNRLKHFDNSASIFRVLRKTENLFIGTILEILKETKNSNYYLVSMTKFCINNNNNNNNWTIDSLKTLKIKFYFIFLFMCFFFRFRLINFYLQNYWNILIKEKHWKKNWLKLVYRSCQTATVSKMDIDIFLSVLIDSKVWKCKLYLQICHKVPKERRKNKTISFIAVSMFIFTLDR